MAIQRDSATKLQFRRERELELSPILSEWIRSLEELSKRHVEESPLPSYVDSSHSRPLDRSTKGSSRGRRKLPSFGIPSCPSLWTNNNRDSLPWLHYPGWVSVGCSCSEEGPFFFRTTSIHWSTTTESTCYVTQAKVIGCVWALGTRSRALDSNWIRRMRVFAFVSVCVNWIEWAIGCAILDVAGNLGDLDPRSWQASLYCTRTSNGQFA